MALQLVKWAKDQGDIFMTYSDYYTVSFAYGIEKIYPLGSYPPKYYGPSNAVLANLSGEIFLNQDKTSMIGILTYDNTKDQQTKNNFIDDLDGECGKITNDFGKNKIKMSMTGESALVKAMNEESRKDVERKDTLTIPLALCVLALIIRSWRLMFIPLLTFGVSICCSFSVMRPVKILIIINFFFFSLFANLRFVVMACLFYIFSFLFLVLMVYSLLKMYWM